VRAFRHDENRVLAAGDELLNEFVLFKCAGDGVIPAVKMNHEIDFVRRVEIFRNKNRDVRIRIMFGGGIKLSAIFVAIGAGGMRKRRGNKLGEEQLAERCEFSLQLRNSFGSSCDK